jgi:hypothetical protein
MMKFWNWWKQHRPIVQYRFWLILMIMNISIAIFVSWAGRAYPHIETTKQVIWAVVMAAACLMMNQIWGYYLDNPEKYEELQKRRLGRTRRGTSSDDEKKQTPEE